MAPTGPLFFAYISSIIFSSFNYSPCFLLSHLLEFVMMEFLWRILQNRPVMLYKTVNKMRITLFQVFFRFPISLSFHWLSGPWSWFWQVRVHFLTFPFFRGTFFFFQLYLLPNFMNRDGDRDMALRLGPSHSKSCIRPCLCKWKNGGFISLKRQCKTYFC